MLLKGIGVRLHLFVLLLLWHNHDGFSQEYPEFGPERAVNIIGLDFDAMEPFISPDGKYLFFNNVNDGINTKLFYAEYVNDSTFNLIGELPGTGQASPPYLDAVADMDSLGNFYWTSTRDYPSELDNLHCGKFDGSSVTDIGRVRGDFNMSTPGWLVMDHGISYDGQLLYFSNARFNPDECTGPCETHIGIARKANASTFNTIQESTTILANVNDPEYIYYAPCITSDNLELYYTRYLKGEVTIDTQIEICVAIRKNPNEPFSVPQVLVAGNPADIVEAATLTSDKSIMYYHKKMNGVHKIRMRYRQVITGLAQFRESPEVTLTVMPNPTNEFVTIVFTGLAGREVSLSITDLSGHVVRKFSSVMGNQITLSINDLEAGIYVVHLQTGGSLIASQKLMIH